MAALAPAPRAAWLDLGDHMNLLHGRHTADLAIAYHDPVKGWTERICSTPDAADIISLLTSRNAETFIGQSGYHGHRRVLKNVSTLPALFVDLDYGDTLKYRRAKSIHPVYADLRKALPNLPEPTLLASSSQHGGYAVWILNDPLPADNLPAWQQAQDTLCRILKPYGADGRARDATRVLRVPGSHHPSGETVRYWQVGETYRFETLERALEPFTPQHPAKIQPEQKNRPKAPIRRLLNGYSLANGRMRDLHAIAASRAPMTDYRKRMLFVYSVCAAWFCPTTDALTREIENFAQCYFADPQRYPAKSISTTRRRMEDAKAGIKVPWNSPRGLIEVDPRYRLRTDTIINWLCLDPAEMEGCQILIPDSLRLERRALAEAQRRRAKGAKEREAYLAEAQHRRQLALDLTEQGKTIREVAKEIGCSNSLVQKILKANKG